MRGRANRCRSMTAFRAAQELGSRSAIVTASPDFIIPSEGGCPGSVPPPAFKCLSSVKQSFKIDSRIYLFEAVLVT